MTIGVNELVIYGAVLAAGWLLRHFQIGPISASLSNSFLSKHPLISLAVQKYGSNFVTAAEERLKSLAHDMLNQAEAGATPTTTK